MKRTLFAALAAATAFGAFAAETRVEKLGDDIWHVRVSRDGVWRDSHMKRYGIVADLPVSSTGDTLDFGVVSPSVKLVGNGFELRFPLAPGERIPDERQKLFDDGADLHLRVARGAGHLQDQVSFRHVRHA